MGTCCRFVCQNDWYGHKQQSFEGAEARHWCLEHPSQRVQGMCQAKSYQRAGLPRIKRSVRRHGLQRAGGYLVTTYSGIRKLLIIPQIVLDNSSKLDDDTITQTLNYNHVDMCRYATRDDEGYRVVGDEISCWAKKASEFHGLYGRGTIPMSGARVQSRSAG